MSSKNEPLFLARETYRRRRVMDAARFLPYAAIFLFSVPVLWSEFAGTGSGLIYLFLVWTGLILAAFGLARPLSTAPDPRESETVEEDG